MVVTINKISLKESKYPSQYKMIRELMMKAGVDCPIFIDDRDQYTGTADNFGV